MSTQTNPSRPGFSAVLAFRVDVADDPEHPRWEAQVVVLPAADEDSAKDAADRYGRGEECTYTNGDGKRVSWTYLETLYLGETSAPVTPEPTEVMSWPIYNNADLEQIARVVAGNGHRIEATATVHDIGQARTRREARHVGALEDLPAARKRASGARRKTATRRKTAARTATGTRAKKTASRKSAKTAKRSTAKRSTTKRSTAKGTTTKRRTAKPSSAKKSSTTRSAVKRSSAKSKRQSPSSRSRNR
jgi:hypothetical protein